jgi:hypothetical protein
MAETTHDQLAVFLPGNRTAFAPGERIEVTVLWAFSRVPGTIDVRLFWITRGKGTEDIEIVDRSAIRAPAIAGEERCVFVLPGAPWSFSGKLISLVWGVEAVVASPEQAARCEFVLAPGAAEIRLGEIAPAAGGFR